MSAFLASIVWDTLWRALLAVVVVSAAGTPLAYALARYDFPGKTALTALISLPLVLPPTAVGYLLLRLLADDGLLGRESLGFDPQILFTWKAVVLAGSVMSFPLFVRTARVGFEDVPPRLEAMSRSLGYGFAQTFIKITLPLAGRGLTAATVLAFTRAVGEFGATIIVAGNIPGETRGLASAIYSAEQAGQEDQAAWLLIAALLFGFTAVFVTEWLSPARRRSKSW